MSTTETLTLIPAELDHITVVLRAKEGGTLKPILPFLKLGDQFAAEGFTAVIAGVSDEDLFQVLGRERDERWMQVRLQEEALGAPAHLAAHAQEMFDLLHRINVKVGGLNAVVGHGGEPSEQMWEEHDEAMDAIWDLLTKVKSAASVDKGPVNQIAETGESVNQQQNALQNIPVIIPDPTDSMHIDDRVRMAANAKRYEWLRDVAATTGSGHTPMVKVAGGPGRWRTGEDLDQSIDQAIRAWPGQQDEEQHPCID